MSSNCRKAAASGRGRPFWGRDALVALLGARLSWGRDPLVALRGAPLPWGRDALVALRAEPNATRASRPQRKRGVALAVVAACVAAVTARATDASHAVDAPSAPRVLHVAADPNNLPFSNERGEGFENKLADLLARDLGARVEYTWWAQRRGWVRQTMKERACDLVLGVPNHMERMLTTKPYYRSTYTMVYRADRHLALTSLDDPALRTLRIGVQMIGDDFANTPPAHALSRRGIIDNVRGYTVYGDYQEPNPPARIVEAVLKGDIDVAMVWGPLAGYFAGQHARELTVVPLPPFDRASAQPFAFDISIGVRKDEPQLRDQLNAWLVQHQAEVDALLAHYGVPRLATGLTASLP